MNEHLAMIAELAERDPHAILSRWQALLTERGASGHDRIKDGWQGQRARLVFGRAVRPG